MTMAEKADKKTVERRVADAVLQTPERVVIAGQAYTVRRPTLRTMIELSGLLAEAHLPDIDEKADVAQAVVATAGRIGPVVADALALMIVGSDGSPARRHIWQVWRPKTTARSLLARHIERSVTPEEAFRALMQLLHQRDTAFFFSTINFLRGVQILRPTTTTASGR